MHIRSRLLFCTYRILTTFAAPLGAAFISYKKRRDPPYGRKIFELLGIYRITCSSCVWFHGASVGEVTALVPVIREYQKLHPNDNIVLTTMTTTGAAAAAKLEHVTVVFSPLDSPCAVKSFIRHFNPELMILFETELWPNMLYELNRHKCPVVIINARMQEKNCKKYLKHRIIVEDLISSHISRALCISQADKERFQKIGIDKSRLCVTGNIKYDLKPREILFEKARAIKSNILGNHVFGAISVHDGEEQIIIKSYLEAKKKMKDLRLLIVPRHKTATEKCGLYLLEHNIPFVMKSSLDDLYSLNQNSNEVLIGDTFGEMEWYMGLCDLVLLGGSYDTTGGHNPLEPAYFSLPILTGPVYHNFQETFDRMIDSGGCFVATNGHDLTSYILKILSNPTLAAETGIKALDEQHKGRGALIKTLEQIDLLLYSS